MRPFSPTVDQIVDPESDCYDPVSQLRLRAGRGQRMACPGGFIKVAAGQSLSALQGMYPPPAPTGAPRQQDTESSPPKSPNAAGKGPSPSVVAGGTGFFVTRSGEVVTNEHVVRGCDRVEVRSTDRAAAQAEIVGVDRNNDLALLRTKLATEHPARFRSGPIRQAEQVIAYGFPYGGALSSGGSATMGSISALTGARDDARLLQMSAPVQPGNSGGPLLDMAGNVVGVVASKLDAVKVAIATADIPQNINFAIKVHMVTAFLDGQGIGYRTAVLSGAKSAADIASSARAMTVFVACFK
jgi:serine protease Do